MFYTYNVIFSENFNTFSCVLTAQKNQLLECLSKILWCSPASLKVLVCVFERLRSSTLKVVTFRACSDQLARKLTNILQLQKEFKRITLCLVNMWTLCIGKLHIYYSDGWKAGTIPYIWVPHCWLLKFTYGQESPGWISLFIIVTFFLFFLKISWNLNYLGKID